MNIIVRDYQQDDWPILKEMILEAENFGQPFLENEKLRIDVFAAFPDFGRVLIANDSSSGTVVGYSAIQFDWKALVINSIITHHDYLRRGIGRALVDAVKGIGEAHPVTDVVRVDTGDFMDYAKQFYLSCGFEGAGFVSHYLSWKNHQEFFIYQLKKK